MAQSIYKYSQARQVTSHFSSTLNPKASSFLFAFGRSFFFIRIWSVEYAETVNMLIFSFAMKLDILAKKPIRSKGRTMSNVSIFQFFWIFMASFLLYLPCFITTVMSFLSLMFAKAFG